MLSIQSEIDRISGNVEDAYTAAAAKGATMPATQNSANLASTIATISGGVTPDDYIVEQGVSGIYWNYRKWNSGFAECWGTIDHSLTLSAQWTTPIYYNTGGAIQEDLPSGLFLYTTGCSYSISSVGSSGGDAWPCIASASPLSSTKTCGIYLLRIGASSSAKTYSIEWYVRGGWKM